MSKQIDTDYVENLFRKAPESMYEIPIVFDSISNNYKAMGLNNADSKKLISRIISLDQL